MKVVIIGVGFVGTACAKAMLLRGSCHEIVLIDLPDCEQHTRGVRNDLSHGAPFCPPTRLNVGDYPDLRDASAIVITAGINEKAGDAIDRTDKWGRQRLLSHNAGVYREIIKKIIDAKSNAPIVVVTDPPDTLADVALDEITARGGGNPVLSAGTFLDTMRFRIQIAERLECSAECVNAFVIGEHGKTQVYLWSRATVGGVPIADLVPTEFASLDAFRKQIEQAVIDANIDIIEATDASQHGIGMVTARIVEAILRDEGLVAPVGVRLKGSPAVTLSLPCIIGRCGVRTVLTPPLDNDEEERFQASREYVQQALDYERNGVDPNNWT